MLLLLLMMILLCVDHLLVCSFFFFIFLFLVLCFSVISTIRCRWLKFFLLLFSQKRKRPFVSVCVLVCCCYSRVGIFVLLFLFPVKEFCLCEFFLLLVTFFLYTCLLAFCSLLFGLIFVSYTFWQLFALEEWTISVFIP